MWQFCYKTKLTCIFVNALKETFKVFLDIKKWKLHENVCAHYIEYPLIFILYETI